MAKARRKEGGAKETAQAVAGLLVLIVVVFVMGLWFAGNPGPRRTVAAQVITATTVSPPPSASKPNARPTVDRVREPDAVRELTLATWNVRDCAIVDKKTGIRSNFHAEIARIVKNAGVDILVLQEIQAEGEPGADVTSLGFALAKAGWTMPYTAVLETGTEDDLAIFSRYRIMSQETVAAPAWKGAWPRAGLLVRIDAKGRELTVIDLHLKAMSDSASLEQRRAQAKALADYLRSRVDADRLFVVAGDMNTTSVGDRLQTGGGSDTSMGTELGKPKGSFGPNGEATAGTELGIGGATTLGYLQVRDDAEGGNDLFAVNEYLLPGRVTYDAGPYRNILDHILLSAAAREAYEDGSVAVLDSDPDVDMGAISDHFPVLLKLKLSLLER
jgi:endonuclease/exonuclease/phosphatase family metal-dependent hydrolase